MSDVIPPEVLEFAREFWKKHGIFVMVQKPDGNWRMLDALGNEIEEEEPMFNNDVLDERVQPFAEDMKRSGLWNYMKFEARGPNPPTPQPGDFLYVFQRVDIQFSPMKEE
jgi:hypothetical protein